MASIQSARLIDGTDEGPLRAVAVIPTGYVPGELLPPDGDVAPVITPITPALLGELAAYAPVSFSIASSADLSSLVIWAQGGPRSEVIYDATVGAGAQPGYAVDVVSGGGTTTVTVRCNDGWPAGTKVWVSTSAGGAFAVSP